MRARAYLLATKGLSYVELLIIVIVLVILALIIGRQLSGKADDAADEVYETRIASIRAAIDHYRQQHSEYPGAVSSAGAHCVNGTAIAAKEGQHAFLAQLQNYTNVAGEACTEFDPDEFRFGPYLAAGLPNNPKGISNSVTVVAARSVGLSSGHTGGWRFNAVTGELIGDE